MMPIYESSKDYGTGVVLILWDGDKPSDEEFLDHARAEYGTDGTLEIDYPTEFRGMTNPGTATVTPNLNSTTGDMRRCKPCRETGAIHCSDPENCGGPWTVPNAALTGHRPKE